MYIIILSLKIGIRGQLKERLRSKTEAKAMKLSFEEVKLRKNKGNLAETQREYQFSNGLDLISE